MGKIGRMFKMLDRRKVKFLLKWVKNLDLNLPKSDGHLKLSDKEALLSTIAESSKSSILLTARADLG